MSCIEKLRKAAEKADSLVCVGLDTDMDKIPALLASQKDGGVKFNEAIIRSTSDLVCAYKPNSAFYEAMGSRGIEMLQRTCQIIPGDIPVILDIKRGDIGNTASKYADFAYDIIGADAVTVNPYMGFDAVRPFLREGKCVFVLCLTSNPSSEDFQMFDTSGGCLFEKVASKAVEWAEEGEVGIVVGATRPGYMKKIREIVGDMPILVPGVGAQGGDVEAVIGECGGKSGSTVVNSSRAILYASSENDFPEAARRCLNDLRDKINSVRKER
ncbi:MAG: orotidine-5'-phosphate decarboxylase [Candidatus Latescibacteria bacterium]|nr:orotidine-5'-phosphate decarboxylase [Candidatus Latescibacterota bacterium]